MTRKGKSAAPVAISDDKRWQREDDLRTLQRAAEVKGDPARMKAAMALHEQQRKGLASITGAPAPARSSSHKARLNNRRI